MKKENKKVNNLEVFKKVIATLLATVTIGTMSGCEGKKVPVEPTPTPGITTPVDPEPTPVEVDPNAPLFDIQDEEVFNQKVDEMYNEVKDLVNDGTNALFTREEIEELIIIFNISNLSQQQYNKINEYDMIDFSRVFDSYAYIQSDKIMNKKESHFADFSSDPQFVSILTRLDNFINDYNSTKIISEECVKEIDKVVDEYEIAIELGDKASFPLRMYSTAIYQICSLNERETGIHYEQKDTIFDMIPTDLESYQKVCNNIQHQSIKTM